MKINIVIVFVTIGALLIAGDLCRAQANNTLQSDTGIAKLSAPLVDWNNGQMAQRMVQSWLQKGEVPNYHKLNKVVVTGLIGVKVTFRIDGAVAGWGESYIDRNLNSINSSKPVNMIKPLSQAAKYALKRLQNHLDNAKLQSIKNKDQQKQNIPKIPDIASRLMVDIQLGYNLKRIRLSKDAKSSALVHTFSPDWNGLMLLGGSINIDKYSSNQFSDASFIWPATAQSQNIAPSSQIISLLHKQGLGLKALKDVAMPGGAKLWKFKVVHVVRPSQLMPVMHLQRGNVLLPEHAISGATLNEISEKIANALRNKFVPDKKVLRGTFLPSTGNFKPSLAKPRDVNLACYALTRRAKFVLKNHSNNSTARKNARLALETAQKTLKDNENNDKKKYATLALGLLTMCDTPVNSVNKNLRDKYGNKLLTLIKNKTIDSFAVNSLSIAALASWYKHTRADKTQKVITKSVSSLWKKMSDRPNISALQWLLLAQIKMEASGYKNNKETKDYQDTARHLIKTLIARQVTDSPKYGPADAVGGYQLMGLPSDSPPTPNWHSAQVVSILTLGLKQKNLASDEDNITWLLSAGLGARFIGQLMIVKPSCWYIRDKKHALGNIRSSLWDNSLSVAATAESLLAVVRLQQIIANTNNDLKN